MFRAFLLLSCAWAVSAARAEMVFSARLGSSPSPAEHLRLGGAPTAAPPFTISQLATGATGDLFLLGTVTTGRLPWLNPKGLLPHSPYCGTYMTPQICRTPFLARLSADGSRVLASTPFPYPGRPFYAAHLALELSGNAWVLLSVGYLGANLSDLHLCQVAPDGEILFTSGRISGVRGIALVYHPDGHLIVVGRHQRWPMDPGGYLAAFSLRGVLLREWADLPWTPLLAGVDPAGSVYVVSDAALRKYDSRLEHELAAVPVPPGLRALDVSTPGQIRAAASAASPTRI